MNRDLNEEEVDLRSRMSSSLNLFRTQLDHVLSGDPLEDDSEFVECMPLHVGQRWGVFQVDVFRRQYSHPRAVTRATRQATSQIKQIGVCPIHEAPMSKKQEVFLDLLRENPAWLHDKCCVEIISYARLIEDHDFFKKLSEALAPRSNPARQYKDIRQFLQSLLFLGVVSLPGVERQKRPRGKIKSGRYEGIEDAFYGRLYSFLTVLLDQKPVLKKIKNIDLLESLPKFQRIASTWFAKDGYY